jgi:hypothetical protein
MPRHHTNRKPPTHSTAAVIPTAADTVGISVDDAGGAAVVTTIAVLMKGVGGRPNVVGSVATDVVVASVSVVVGVVVSSRVGVGVGFGVGFGTGCEAVVVPAGGRADV